MAGAAGRRKVIEIEGADDAVLEQFLTSSRGPERRPSCSPPRAEAENP
jgi:hypothetical protein